MESYGNGFHEFSLLKLEIRVIYSGVFVSELFIQPKGALLIPFLSPKRYLVISCKDLC